MELIERFFLDVKIRERIYKNRVLDVYVNLWRVWEFVSLFGLVGRKVDKVYIFEKGWEGICFFFRVYFDCDVGVDKNVVVLVIVSREMVE